MPYRSLELYTLRALEGLEAILEEHPVTGSWQSQLDEKLFYLRVLVREGDSQALIDRLVSRYSHDPKFRLIVQSVEASLPRPTSSTNSTKEKVGEDGLPEKKRSRHVSRDELYTQLVDKDEGRKLFIIMVLLSTLVAAVGLLKSSEAVIIGAMVLAPLLKPNMTLALGTTLGDISLIKKSIRTTALGFLSALALSFLIGMGLTIDPTLTEISVRTSVDGLDLVLATASGVAGALALTTGASSSLIGVMVAVALLPPLVTTGLLLGDGQYELAKGAGLLVATNVICVNIAAIGTFLAQRIAPARFYEAEKARKATKRAITLWAALLITLLVLLYLQGLLQKP